MLLALSVGALRVQSFAQFITGENIKLFDAEIIVNTDNSINVRELIVYSSGGITKHGIYRDIYPYSAEKRKMDIDNISVRDEMGNSYIFTDEKAGKNIRIKIGDPNTTFSGEKTYIISYTASKAVSQLEDIDEIYWNVTGNEWTMPILRASSHVTIPNGAVASQSTCYYGIKGSTNRCLEDTQSYTPYGFETPSLLAAGEGLTVAVGFTKGIVDPYTLADNIFDIFYKYLPYAVAIILPLIAFIFSYRYWRKNGRDERETNVIVAEYDVPDNLTPLEVSAILDEQIDPNKFSAEIIYLATKGYLKIGEIETKTLGIFTNKDYELIKLKDNQGELNESDTNLLNALFMNGDTVKLSDLKNTFYKSVNSITDPALTDLISEGYYKNLGRARYGQNLASIISSTFLILFFIFTLIFLPEIYGLSGTDPNISYVLVGLLLSGLIISIFYFFSPAKTVKGVEAKEKILGLKEYMKIAEKDRLIFANAPESRPEVFEKLLPYAMTLGVADIWAKEFDGIYLTPPSWYIGASDGNFSAMALASSLGDFNNSYFIASSAPGSRGGGSSGGGFSGGGGGGGGGGSW